MANAYKTIGKILFIGSLTLIIFLSGCDLLTKTQAPNGAGGGGVTGTDLVFNEIFTLSPDKYYTYSWIELLNLTDRPIKWYDQTFPGSGTVVGDGGTITQTDEDGNIWVDTLTAGSYGTLNDVTFPNLNSGFACGNNGGIYIINKNGLVSLQSNLPAPSGNINYTNLNYYSISGTYRYVNTGRIDVQARAAIAVGDSGVMIRTLDRGQTWSQVPTGGLPANLHKRLNYVFYNFLNVLVVGEQGVFLQSSNAGTKWSAKVIPEPYRATDFYSCWLLDTLAWATGANGTILVSTNGGNVWLPETSHVSVNLRSCFFGATGPEFIPGQGWIVGDNGTILRTENNGAKWKKYASGTTAQLNSVWFVDSLRGWAFGNGGVIVATKDGGRSWLTQSSGTSRNLHGVDFLPLMVRVQNGYFMTMHAQRNFVFFDPATFTLNPDFITKTDTGIVAFQPQDQSLVVNPRGFVVITNDSIKFQDHTKLGPGDVKLINFGFAVDTNGLTQPGYNALAHLVKWNLLPSAEIRLVKFFQKTIGGNTVLGFTVRTVDVVRWGGYRPTPDDYPLNVPAGFIPENWSLARYKNDPGENPAVESTASSFYLCNQPIPGWYSQQGK